jgi:hypothetical protein
MPDATFNVVLVRQHRTEKKKIRVLERHAKTIRIQKLGFEAKGFYLLDYTLPPRSKKFV